MVRKSLAIPAAAFMILSGATTGIGRMADPAHARVSSANFSGTISITDYQTPNGLGAGAALSAAEANAELTAATSDALLGLDNKGNFYPDLVTEVPSTANGGLKVVNGDEIITWHLKPNQKWSDGSPVTNLDWIANYWVDFAPDIGATQITDLIRTVTFSGNDMVWHLKGVLGSALQQLDVSPTPIEYMEKKYGVTISGLSTTTWDYNKEIDPKTDEIPASVYASSGLKKFIAAYSSDNYNSPSDIFNGPYKLAQWSPDQRYVLTANPFYTALPADPKHPRPQTIQMVVVSENGTTYIQDLKANSTYNQIDEAQDFTPDNVTDLKQTKYNVVSVPGLTYELLDFMLAPTYLGKPNPLHDLRVRLALDYAIDRFKYLKAEFPAYDPKQLSLASMIPAASPWSINSQLPQNDYNPAKARALLKQAGYATTIGTGGNHLNLDFVTTTKASRIKGAQLLQRFWNQVGINIRVRFAQALGQNGLFSSWADGGIQDHHTFQISLHGYLENPDPDEGSLSYLCNQITSATEQGGANVDALCDPKLDAMWIAGRTTLDNAKRHQIYNQIQKYFYQQMYNISLFSSPNIAAVKGTIGNFKPTETQSGNQWNAYQWWYDPTNSQKPLLQ